MPASMAESALPFPRGRTAGDGELSLDDTTLQDLEGKRYVVDDDVHNTGLPVVLMVVKNDTGAAITVARKFGEFSAADTYDMGRRLGQFPANTEGAIAVPLDDKYTVGQSIPDDDLFYVILKGPVSVLAAATVVNLAAHIPVMTSSTGLVADAAAPTAGSFVIGTLAYAASYVAGAAVVVLADCEALKKSPA